MTRDDYYDVIDFTRLKRYLFVHARELCIVARDAGIGPQVLADMMNGKSLPKVSTVVSLCSVLGCQPGDIMEFKGIDYRKIWVPEDKFPEGCVLSYQPLRYFCESKFPDKTFTECMGMVKHFEPDENVIGIQLRYKIVGEGTTKGLFADQIARLNNDKDCSIRLIYNVSEAFKLPVDMIIGYKYAVNRKTERKPEDLLI